MLQYTAPLDNKSLFEIIRRACNCVDARLMDHGLRVARLAVQIARRMGEGDRTKLRDLRILAMLHDIGAYKTEEISKMLLFETRNIWEHSIYGFLFLKHFSPLGEMASVILYHHMPWEELKEEPAVKEEIKTAAQILHLADRIDVYLHGKGHTWESCAAKLKEGRSVRFAPRLVDLVLEGGFSPAPQPGSPEDDCRDGWGGPLTREEVTAYLKMLIYIIDFRSRHTVTHTVATTSISREIGVRLHLGQEYLDKIVCGALLHDVGKIGVPVEILEYPGKLSPQAMKIMQGHVEITGRILGSEIDETIRRIAMRHHEKLDGSGYPLGLEAKDLTVGERIVAVADIVSALSGTRSYKDAYSQERVCSIISSMKEGHKIDGRIVDIVNRDYGEIMEATRRVCQPVLDRYGSILAEYRELQRRFMSLHPPAAPLASEGSRCPGPSEKLLDDFAVEQNIKMI